VTAGDLAAQIGVYDTTAYNGTPTAGIFFAGKYNVAGDYAGLGAISVSKLNTTTGNTTSYMSFGVRLSGVGDVDERMRLTVAGLWIGGTPASPFEAATPLEVYAASGAQLRLTQTQGSKYCDFTVDGSGNLTISPVGSFVFSSMIGYAVPWGWFPNSDADPSIVWYKADKTTPVMTFNTLTPGIAITGKLSVTGDTTLSGLTGPSLLCITAGEVIDDDTTALTPQFLRLGLGAAAHASIELYVTGEAAVTQYLNVGTTTSAAAQGDLSAGLTGAAARLFYDQSAGELALDGAGAAGARSLTFGNSADTSDVRLIVDGTTHDFHVDLSWYVGPGTTSTPNCIFIKSGAGATSGFVGIGHDSPTMQLHVSSSDATTVPSAGFTNSSTGDAAIRFALGTTISYALGIDNSVAGDPFVLSTAASGTAVLGTGNLLTITSAGNATLTGTFQTTNIGIGIAPTHADVFGNVDGLYIVGSSLFARDLDVDTAYFVRYGSNSTTKYDVSHNTDVGGVCYKVAIRNTANIAKNYEITVKMSSLADDSNHTLTDQIGIYVEANLKGSTGAGVLTVNNTYGMLCGAQTIGANNNTGIRIYGPTGAASVANYGLFIDAPSGAAANYGIYNNGTLAQITHAYIGGDCHIGTVLAQTALSKLHVETQTATNALIKTAADTINETASLSFAVTSGTTNGKFTARSADIKATRVTGSSFNLGFFCSDSATNNEVLRLTGATLATTLYGPLTGTSADFVAAAYPVLQATRTTAGTAASYAAVAFKAQSSGDMTDGFGPNVILQIRDTAGVDNPIAYFGAVRNGADGSGDLLFGTYAAGSAAEHFRLTTAGDALLQGTNAAGARTLTLQNIGDGGGSTTPYFEISCLLSGIRNGGAIRFGRDDVYGGAASATSNLVFYTSIANTNTERLRISSTEFIGNDTGGDFDHRFEGDTLPYMLFCDASAATENIALLTTAAPNWQTMDRGLFIGDCTTAPVAAPSGGTFHYGVAGDWHIGCPAAKTLVLDQVVYKDENLGASRLSRPASSAPDIVQFKDSAGANTGVETFAFAAGECVTGTIEMDHDYKEGSDLTFHIHFEIIAAPAGGTDNIKWQITYHIARDGSLMTVPVTIVKEMAVTTQYTCYRADFTAINGSNSGPGGTALKIGDQICLQLSRIAASADEFGGDGLLETFGIHYQVDTIGSRAITAK
jgi:hypothetical protein